MPHVGLLCTYVSGVQSIVHICSSDDFIASQLLYCSTSFCDFRSQRPTIDTYPHILASLSAYPHLSAEQTAQALQMQPVRVECPLTGIDGLAYGHACLKCLDR